jgi:hypothetical protein
MRKIGIALAGLLVLGLFGLIVFRAAWVDHVENYELGYKFDSRDGTITVLPHTGYVVTAPVLVSVYTIDLRPMQVCINANARVLNCKLVQFNPKGIDLFLSWHGRNDYPQGGTNTDGSLSSGSLNAILMSYAFDGSGKTYPFMTILRELKPEETAPTP